MSQAVNRYNVLYESLLSRSRRVELPRGLDTIAAWSSMRVRNRGVTRATLLARAQRVDALAREMRNHSDGALDASLGEVREVFVRRRHDGRAVERALAMTREVARRETGEEPFAVQLAGALALHSGCIVEMLTGEGKTLTGSVVAPLIAWEHRRLHVFTVNDYLARRDAKSREAIYKRCGVSVGAIQHEQEPGERFEVYSRGIVYGTPKQITADWLRDQIRLGSVRDAWTARAGAAKRGGTGGGPMVPGLHAALIDEADAVLIDEGVVPLIIARSRREDELSGVYRRACEVAAKLDEGPDYEVDHLRKKAELKRRGVDRVALMLADAPEAIFRATRRAEELVRQALVALHCYKRGQQYQIVDGRVVIVDEYTGRFLADRSWEFGLHQAVEAKEGLEVTADRETLARMSFQRFYRTYPFLCGMTGTAADAAGEMERIYSRRVLVIPPNKPVVREAWPMRVFATGVSKWAAIVSSIVELHGKGRPILAGTRSIESSELLSERLEAAGVPHRVLNANFDKDEAELIALAGRGSKHEGGPAVTVATNMAGRGTDILLDDEAREAGGLHVILTEMHTAKRIDRQFIGRAGRQGDPGSSQAFVSLDDELIRLHAPKAGALALARAGRDELTPTPQLRALFRHAQRRAESRARRERESVLRQDDWIERYLPGS